MEITGEEAADVLGRLMRYLYLTGEAAGAPGEAEAKEPPGEEVADSAPAPKPSDESERLRRARRRRRLRMARAQSAGQPRGAQ